MSKSGILILAILSICFAFGWMEDKVKLVYPTYFPSPTYNFESNSLESNKIELGRALFYDPILSADSTISCASCHSPYSAFTHGDHALSHGIHDRIGRRNSPALMNLAWMRELMWDGAVNHLDMQALAPLHSESEMAEDISNVLLKINRNPRYKAFLFEAFQDSTLDSELFLKSIAQFELTLISSNSKYDKIKSGTENLAFTAQEENGYQLFKTHCNSCHTEPLFSNYSFQNNGLSLNPEIQDLGRFEITQNESDTRKFKVPTLRNIEFSSPYMHDGRFKKLSEVIDHYSEGIEVTKTLGEELKNGIKLSSNEEVDLIAFLLTLSDKDFIFNPKHSFPRDFFFSDARDKP